MSYKKYCGRIKMLGNSVRHANSQIVYSVIEMEDSSIVQGIYTYPTMDNYLKRAFKSENPVSFWVRGKRLVAVSIDGTGYVDKAKYFSKTFCIVWFVISIPLCFLFGIGFFVFAYFVYQFMYTQDVDKIILELPNAQLLNV